MPIPGDLRPSAVPPVSLAGVTAALGIAGLDAAHDVEVSGVTHDSRAVRAGDLYAALPGARAHGADFCGQAVAAGAVAVLTDPSGAARAQSTGVLALVVDDPRARLGEVAALVYGEPADRLLLLGVTGTNGKTTCAYLLESGLAAAGHRTGLVGTVETRVAGEAMTSVRTTPESTDLQALFAVMLERGVTATAMEVSSHALALHRVAGTVFDVAGFTNLSQDHLEFHGDLEGYYRAKAALFMPRYSTSGVVTVDDAYGRRLAGEATVPVTTLSTASISTEPRSTAPFSAAPKPADWQAVDLRPHPSGAIDFRLTGPGGVDVPARSGLPGEFNVANAALAIVMLVQAGIALDRAVEGVGACASVPGRMERVEAGQPFLAVVDYAHTPNAVARLLEAVRPATKGRLLLVLGCGGDRDPAKRPAMGQLAARGADLLVVTDDNPRSESPSAIRQAMLAGALDAPPGRRGEVLEVGDRRAAIMEVVGRAGPDDTVVVAGKGHEPGQEVAGVVHPFDDRVVLREAIEAATGAAP